MYLVDSSAWVDALRPKPGRLGQRLRQLETADAALFLCGPVMQELVQGARDEMMYARYHRLFSAQAFIAPIDPMQTYAAAGLLYARCRWRGITPRSPTDCLIAQLAMEHHLTLLHDDGDYDKIAKVELRLKHLRVEK